MDIYESKERDAVYIWEDGEYDYPAAYGFRPNLRAFIHPDDGITRSCMLVVPGGGYCMCTPFEGEAVALEYYGRGMNTFVLTYTTDITMSVPLKKQPMHDLSRAIRFIRKNSEKYHIAPEKVALCGFSAGGHLCACCAVHFDEEKDVNDIYAGISDRPDAVLLGYPVITSGEYTHIWSIQALIGKNPSENELAYFSAEKNVKENTPPCFIWQTLQDSLVPVENSYLFARALREKKIKFAHYVFPEGDHGLSLAAKDMFIRDNGGGYVMEQLGLALEHVKNRTEINVSDERHEELMNQFFAPKKENEGAPAPAFPTDFSEDAGMWPELAAVWLRRIFA